MEWNEVLNKKEILALFLAIGRPLAKKIDDIELFYPPVGPTPTQEGKDYSSQTAWQDSEPLAASRAAYIDRVELKLTLTNQFFDLPSTQFLVNNGWSPRDVAIFGVLHELAHFLAWLSPSAQLMDDNKGQKAWSGAYSSWPLKSSPKLPGPISAKNNCHFIDDVSPSGKKSPLIKMATFVHEVPWATNLSELRADAIAVAFCLFSEHKIIKKHPLKTNFLESLKTLEAARNITEQNNAPYKWGRLRQFLKQMDKLPVNDQNGGVALAELAAWGCANENWPDFFQATSEKAVFYQYLKNSIPATAKIDAALENLQFLNEIKDMINPINQQREPKSSTAEKGDAAQEVAFIPRLMEFLKRRPK